MIGKKAGMAALWLVLAAAPASAQSIEQQAACRPDARRFCHHVQAGAGNDVYLACLQQHRHKLSAACRKLLEQNGV